MRDFDLEMAFVRQLSVHGLRLTPELSQEARRERIRVAILMHNLEGKTMGYGPDHQRETYGAAYARCYGEQLDQRRIGRDAFGRPIMQLRPSPLEREPSETPQREDDEGDEDEDGLAPGPGGPASLE